MYSCNYWKLVVELDKYKNNILNLNQSSGAVSMVFIPGQKILDCLSSLETIGSVSTTKAKPDVKIAVPHIWFSLPTTQVVSGDRQCEKTACSQITKPVRLVSEVKVSKRDRCNIRTKDDKGDSWITGMAITTNGIRLLVDYYNCKVKMFFRDI